MKCSLCHVNERYLPSLKCLACLKSDARALNWHPDKPTGRSIGTHRETLVHEELSEII